MSVSRETIAAYYNADPEEINCEGCRYGGGEILIECRLWSCIMKPNDFCSLWDREDKEAEGDRVHDTGRSER